ncbi:MULTISPECIES: hypothetical protein [unclassified Bradyrhizobium]|uniref:hypothetical protein n=1 Tax=unclassified Bradyrhizobium TaxID=2631580 RepID=UPI002479D388|nr:MULTISPECIES: hypothetical protein [unclassified Bradyrhizobium]WGS21480.1 hypothetical protein MTX22_07090 [Bradyrhizobium sp. ISRA463]WGS28416.1 hypothetical protein MTX19_04935 [Bradyrhizobium sp. ISRA464]
MFEKLAKFRPFEPRQMTPWTVPYANDNLPGFRRPEGRRRRPTSAPACYWVLIDGRLECRWTVEDTIGSFIDDLDRQRRADRGSGPRATIAHPAALKTTASA